VTVATGPIVAATINRAGLGTPSTKARPVIVRGRLSRATAAAGDLLGATALVLSIPFVILAIAIPIALCVRLLLWIVGMF
jgi:hypothetical protein